MLGKNGVLHPSSSFWLFPTFLLQTFLILSLLFEGSPVGFLLMYPSHFDCVELVIHLTIALPINNK